VSFRSACIALICLLLAAVPAPADESPGVILVLGDSLSAAFGIRREEGWVALLQQRLAAKGYEQRVVNASASGETTGGALARLPRLLSAQQPSIVVVELGGNDGLRGLPLEGVRRNLEAIIDAAIASGARVLLLGIRIPPNYGPTYTEGFFALYGELARTHDLPLVPFLLDGIALDDSLMQDDGFHPNAAAQPRMLDAVWPKLEPLLQNP
jgi:acyl-CoA thioesterase-1